VTDPIWNTAEGRVLLSAASGSNHRCPTCGLDRWTLTQTEVGRAIGCSQPSVSNHLHGRYDLSEAQFEQALQVLAVPRRDFVRMVRRLEVLRDRASEAGESWWPYSVASELVRSWARRTWTGRPTRGDL